MTGESCGKRTPLRIGLLIDGVARAGLASELTEWAAAREDVEIGCTIVDGARRDGPKSGKAPARWPRDAVTRMLLSLVYGAEARLFGGRRLPAAASASRPAVAGALLASRTEDLELIRARGLDVLVRCGSAIPDDDLLVLCPHGVLSIRDGEGGRNRTGPDGFWEVYRRLAETRFILEKLGDRRSAGAVLFRGAIQTQPFYFMNLRALRRQSMLHMTDLLGTLAATRRLPPAIEPTVDGEPPSGSPRPIQILAYVAHAWSRVARKIVRRLSGRRTRWSIGVVRQGSFPALSLDGQDEVRAARGRSWADPFLWRRGDQLFCLVEDYAPGERGHIAALELRGRDLVPVGEALKEDFHLSFPFLFEYQGEVFMCPETQEAREIRVYSTTSFPLGWRHRATLMRDVAAVDTMLFAQAGRWWMLTTLDRAGTGSNVVELNLFHAADPLSSDWTAHPGNPILVSPAGGRNAGMAVVDGRTFRFGQRQGFDRYGEGLLLFEITKLSTEFYEERLVRRIDPDFDAINGVHHLSVIDGLAVFDRAKVRR